MQKRPDQVFEDCWDIVFHKQVVGYVEDQIDEDFDNSDLELLLNTDRLLVKVYDIWNDHPDLSTNTYDETRELFEKLFDTLLDEDEDEDAEQSPAHEPQADNIKDATFTSVWDGGTEITTKCKVNMAPKEIFDVEQYDGNVEDLDSLAEERVTIDGIDYPALNTADYCDIGDEDFWYEK